jgi:hypothetical protein
VANFQPIAAYTAFGLSILNSALALFNIWYGKNEAVRARQRELRKQFRQVLRELLDACALRPGYSEKPKIFDVAYEQLLELRDEGLKSPSNRHLDNVMSISLEMSERWSSVSSLVKAGGADKNLLPLSPFRETLRNYVEASTKIDNGSFFTYLRYRRPPRKLAYHWVMEAKG